MTNSKQHGSRARLRLSTSLLWLTAAGTGFAYYKAHSLNVRRFDEMQRMRSAAGFPMLRDMGQFQITANNVSGLRADWSIWIPWGKRCNLSYALQALDEEPPQAALRSHELLNGQHRLQVTSNRKTGAWTVILDKKPIFTRQPDQHWNISLPWVALGEIPTDLQSLDLTTPTTLLRAYGKASLGPDETFDPALHRFGLRLWLEE